MNSSALDKSPYQLVLLGSDSQNRGHIRRSIEESLADFGLPLSAISFLDENNAAARNLGTPLMAILFGSPNSADTALIADLISDSVVIVPVVSDLSRVDAEIPPQLRHVNALPIGPQGQGSARLVSLVFETFKLLRRERRLFISYKRSGSQQLAERLYDALDARGFDVFIDVRSVPPATDFQSQLWHLKPGRWRTSLSTFSSPSTRTSTKRQGQGQRRPLEPIDSARSRPERSTVPFLCVGVLAGLRDAGHFALQRGTRPSNVFRVFSAFTSDLLPP